MTLILGGRYRYKSGNEAIQKEMADIWSEKERLIKEIVVKYPERVKEDSKYEYMLGFKSPEQLRTILNG